MTYGKIFAAFWTDSKIRSYSDDGKLLAAYLLSSPHRNLIGCCRLPIGYICDDLQWGGDRVAVALTELASGERPFIVRDPDGWTHIVNSLKYDRIAGQNHFKAAAKLIEQIPKNSAVFSSVAPKLAAIWNDHLVRLPKPLIRYLPRTLLTPPEDLQTPAPAPAPPPEPPPAPEDHKNGADAPSLKSRLFGECLTWMARVNGNADPTKYRSTIGKWIRDHGEAKTLEAFMEAQRGDPAGDPVGYVTAILKRLTHGKRSDEQISGGTAAARILAEARARSRGGGEPHD